MGKIGYGFDRCLLVFQPKVHFLQSKEVINDNVAGKRRLARYWNALKPAAHSLRQLQLCFWSCRYFQGCQHVKMGAKRKQPSGETAPAGDKNEAGPGIEGNGANAEKTKLATGNGVKGKKERESKEDLMQIQATFKSSLFRLQVSALRS